MATIGSITVAFEAQTDGLTSGIDAVVSSLAGVGNAVDALKEKLSGLSSLTVSLAVDTSRVEEASKSVESLKAKAESSSATVSVSADSSGAEKLSETLGETAEASVRARSSLGSLVVTTGLVISTASQAARSFADFRNGFRAFIEATTAVRAVGGELTDADRAVSALSLVIRGLSGDASALRQVFGGVKAGIDEFVQGILSAENVNRILQGTLGGVLRLFGATDDAVVASTQVIANIVTQQVAHAASHRLVQRSLLVVSAAYDSASESLAAFLTETATGRAVSQGIAQALSVVLSVAVQVSAAFDRTVDAVTSFLTSGELAARVSVAVGTAFDSVASSIGGFLARASTLDTGLTGLGLRLALLADYARGLVPSIAQMTTALQGSLATVLGYVPAAARVASSLGLIADGFRLVSVASEKGAGFADWTAALAKAAGTSAAVGALGGAATAAATGGGILAGAMSGAGTAIAGLTAAFPAFIAASVAGAVATGKVADALAHVGNSAEQLGNLSDRFGQPVQEIEKLKIAAESSGVALQSVVRAQQVFSQNASKVKIGNLGLAQTREAKNAFDQLGLSVSELRSSRPEELFLKAAKAITEQEDATKRTQIAMDLFGRTGPQILPLLKNLEQVNEDMGRLGGTISDLDFERFLAVDQSFDRLRTASGALTDDLAIPFTRMGEAFNNVMAELKGGFAPLVGAVSEAIADITTPFAVLAEVVARVINTLLRLAASAAKIITSFLPFAAVATIFELAGDAFNELWSYIEAGAEAFEEFATSVEELMRPSVEVFMDFGEVAADLLNTLTGFLGLGDIFGGPTASVIALAAAYLTFSVGIQTFNAVMATSAGIAVRSAATKAAAYLAAGVAIAAGLVGIAVVGIGVYVAATIAAAATTIASCAAMHVAWLFGLGPIGAVIAAIEAVAIAAIALWAVGSGIVDFFSGWGEGREEIDGATASVGELSAAVAANEGNGSGFVTDMQALASAAGVSEEEIARVTEASLGLVNAVAGLVGVKFEIQLESEKLEEARQAIAGARQEMADFSIRAAQLGTAGADAVAKSSEEFNELQRKLAAGKITLEEFNKESGDIRENLGDALDEIAKGSPEETLRKNLELFKSLDDAAKQAAKSARDIGAGVQIGDKFFPRSSEVKARAKEYADQYSDSLDQIKQKLASGGFQEELDTRRKQNTKDFEDKKIDEKTFRRVEAELDTTSAQEQAKIATEEVQRELDRQNAKLKIELDFADNIRKQLETAFLSPVEKFQKDLDKIRTNVDLTDEEKDLAERDLRKQAREGLIGKTAGEQFNERNRDVAQAQSAGLINAQEAFAETQKAANDLAQALGIPVDPSKELQIAEVRLSEALKNGAISADQFAEGMNESRKKFLESLGIKSDPAESDQKMLDNLNKERSKGQFAEMIQGASAAGMIPKTIADGMIQANGGAGISASEFERGRKGLEDGIVGQSAADRINEERRRITAGMKSGAVSQGRGEAAIRGLDRDRKQAAGLDLTAGEQMQAGVDKINDAFGVTGKSMAEIQATLSPKEFKEFQEAIKKNADAAKAAVGVQKPAIDSLAEGQNKLNQAVRDGVVSQGEAGEAARKLQDDFMSAIGVTKTPFEQFSGQVDNIAAQFGMAGKPLDEVRAKLAGNAEQLALFDRAVQEARDSLLASLGVNKSPEQVFQDQMKKIDEAVNASDPNKRITKAQADQARATATRARNASLGAGEDVAGQLAERRAQIAESFGGGKDSAREKIALNKLEMDKRQAAGLDPTASQSLQAGVAKINDAFGVTGKTLDQVRSSLSPKEFKEYQDAIKKNADAVKESLGIERTPFDKFNEAQDKLKQALDEEVISREEFAKGAEKAKESLLQALGIPLDPVNQLRDRMNDLQEAFNNKAITEEEFARGQEEARRTMLPGGEEESPVKKFQRDIESVNKAVDEGLISGEEGAERRLRLQADLQESLAPALDSLKEDRRQVESSDVRSKSGVDTFFRILRGNDNPSLKAQLEVAKNTKILAEAARQPDAAVVIAQL